MKNARRFFIAGAALALLASAGQVKAGYDGIAASPKVLAMLNERAKGTSAAPAQATISTTTTTPHTAIAASPKVQAMQSAQRTAQANAVQSGYAGYQSTGSDGITASPKLRSMLDERPQTVEVAPLK